LDIKQARRSAALSRRSACDQAERRTSVGKAEACPRYQKVSYSVNVLRLDGLFKWLPFANVHQSPSITSANEMCTDVSSIAKLAEAVSAAKNRWRIALIPNSSTEVDQP
jgi:hypothetical protein